MHNKVIACIDDSQYSESVCDYAAWGAQRMDAPLTLLHVLDRPHGEPAERNLSGAIGFGSQEALLQELAELDERRAKLALEQGKQMLKAAKARVQGLKLGDVETRQRHGDLVQALSELEPETRMLVVGKRGADTASAHGHIGSHLEAIIRVMTKPILVAQLSFQPPKTFMMAYDGSATMNKGVNMVAASPLLKGIPCHLVTVGPDVEATREQLKGAEKILQNAGFEITTAIRPGDPETALPQYQEDQNVDLLILGAHGHSRIRRLFVGSTTTSVLSRTRTSMIILR